MKCPKCHYIRKATDTHIHEGVCPACGIAYQKWLERQQAATQNAAASANTIEENNETIEEEHYSFWQQLFFTVTATPTTVEPAIFWSRTVLWLALAIWWGWIALHGIDWEIIGGSFMHNIDLAFHEFGHVFFAPFGTLMMFLGGSLFQILLPLVPLVVFSFQQRDNFSAGLMLAWCGQNFIDVAPYIRDAEYRALPLVGGASEANHDWGNILTMLDTVQSCYTLAKISFTIGIVIMAAGFAWAAYMLWLQHRMMEK
jgi:hypothetical protein